MSKVVTGAKIELRIGTILVAYASNCSFQYNINIEPIQGIDQITVDEHAELGVNVSFTTSMFRVAHQTAVTMGWQPKLNVILQQPELVATIKDKTTKVTLLQLEGIKLTGRSGSISARGVFEETLSFIGKHFYDEAG